MQKKSLVMNNHGRIIRKPPRYCTTESSTEETVSISNPPKRQATMEDRIQSMMEQLNDGENPEFVLDAEDVADPDIIPSSQTYSNKSLSFNDVLRVTKTRRKNLIEDHRQNSSATSSTSKIATEDPHLATRPGIVGANPLTMSNTSSEQFCNVIVRRTAEHLLELFRGFDDRQDQRFTELTENLKQAHRADMKTLDDHVAERLRHFESAMCKKQTETVYPYEKPAGFPLSSLEAFQNFQDDSEQQQSLKEYLINVGGITARDTLSQFVKEAMTDSLTNQFTWTGKLVHGKSDLRPLFNTSMGTVLYEALLACRNVPKPKDRMEFARLMQDAIRTAKQRLRDANRRTRGSSRVGRRRRYLAEMDEQYPSDNNDEDLSLDVEA